MDTASPDDQRTTVSEPVFIGILWALTATSFLFVLFRLYVQVNSFRRLFIDDFLVILAWVIILAAAIIWQVEGKTLYELYAITAGKEPFSPDFLPRYNKFMRCLAPLEILFYSALWCIKFSFLALFYRLSSKIKKFRIWWFIVFFFTAGVYIASVGDIEYKCSFGGIQYIMEQCPQLKHIRYENRSFWANCAGDVISDLMILSIPILLLWNTNIPRRKKIILLSIFSATILIMVVAVVRVAVDNTLDREINIAWLCFWSFVEVDTAIIVSCVASLRQLFIVSQNQSSSAKLVYQDTREPMLKSPDSTFGHTQTRTLVESAAGDDVVQSPLSIVHVRHDFEVSSISQSNGAKMGKSCQV